MTRGITVVAIATLFVVVACAVKQPPPASTMPPPPPGAPPPRLPGEVDPPPTRLFRIEFDVEPVASPTGDLAERHYSTMAYRFAYFGSYPTPNFGLGLSARVVDTKTIPGTPALYFFDALGFYLRFEIPIAPQLKGYLEAEPSMVIMKARCGNPTDALCDDGFELALRGGITGRAGGLYEVVPGRLDLGGYIALEKTVPDEGGWFSIGVAVVVHTGPTHAEVRRRQQLLQQQQQR